jgi:nitrogen fixation-related uncharacterized protein
MELTGIAVLASLAMAAGAVCVFIYAVKKDHFRDIEEAKYQVFWSDWDEREEATKENRDGGGKGKSLTGN